MKSLFLLTLFICLIVSPHKPVLSADTDAQAEFKVLVRGMLEARKKVRSGKARIEGTKRAGVPDDVPLLDGKVNGTYSFDATTGSYRLEWEVPCMLNIQPAGERTLPEPGKQGTQYNVKFWACRNPEYFADTEDIPGSKPHAHSNLNLRHPEYDSRERGRSCERRPFDPLSAGIIGYFEFDHGEMAADVYEGMLAKTVESYESDGSIVTIVLKDNVARHTLVVDKDTMVPLKLTSRSHTDPSVFTSKAKWKVIGNVAVPVTLTTQLVYPEVTDEVNEYKFHWSRINKPFDAGEFKYTAFTGIPPNIIEVIDNRGKKPEYIGRWYADGKIEKPIDRARRVERQD